MLVLVILVRVVIAEVVMDLELWMREVGLSLITLPKTLQKPLEGGAWKYASFPERAANHSAI